MSNAKYSFMYKKKINSPISHQEKFSYIIVLEYQSRLQAVVSCYSTHHPLDSINVALIK